MNTKTKAVPAFPYEGGLYWLFEGRDADSYVGQHPYYAGLYASSAGVVKHRAASLTALFDEIIMVPADSRLPDHRTHTAGEKYEHPDLRVRVPLTWDDQGSAAYKDANELLLAHPEISEMLDKEMGIDHGYPQELIVVRSLSQIALAERESAVLLGNSHFSRLYTLLLAALADEERGPNVMSQEVWSLGESDFYVRALDFRCDGVDQFAAVRTSSDVRGYAKKMREVIGQCLSAEESEEMFKKLMQEAMEKEHVAKLVRGSFSTIGSTMNPIGFIPLVNIAASITAMGADVASRAAAYEEHINRWYLLGPKMAEVSLQETLKGLKLGAER